MSTQNQWNTTGKPKGLKLFDRAVRRSMGEAIDDGRCEWRITGTAHLEYRSRMHPDLRMAFSLSGSGPTSVLAGQKWRTFLRRIERANNGQPQLHTDA